MNFSNLDFSVVVCCYNPNIDQLKKTVISVIKQKNVSLEIIICDDGSKNNYFEILKEWVDSLNTEIIFKYSFLEKNHGTIKNYLEGIKVSCGKYIKPISPGDYLYDENSLYVYKKKFEEDYDILFSDSIYYFDEKVNIKRQYPISRLIFHKKNICIPYCLYSIFFLGATLCEKREIVLQILLEVENKVLYLEDYSMMTIALIEKKKIAGIEKPLIWYEYGNGISTNNSGRKRMEEDSYRVLNFLCLKYPNCRMVKKMRYKFDIRNRNFVYKSIIFTFKYPMFWIYKIISLIFRQKKYKTSYSNLVDITSL